MSRVPRQPGDHIELLVNLRKRAGWPSVRDIAVKSGVPYTSIANVFSGRNVGLWKTVEPVVRALGASDAELQRIRDRWAADRTYVDRSRGRPGAIGLLQTPMKWLLVPNDLVDGLHKVFEHAGYDMTDAGGECWVVSAKKDS